MLENLKITRLVLVMGIVGELLKYGGSGMVDLLEQLFSVIWQEKIVSRQWRERQRKVVWSRILEDLFKSLDIRI